MLPMSPVVVLEVELIVLSVIRGCLFSMCEYPVSVRISNSSVSAKLYRVSLVPLTARLRSSRRTTVRGHSTGSRSSKSLYYSLPLISTVREAYAPTDYKMLSRLGWWNMTNPV